MIHRRQLFGWAAAAGLAGSAPAAFSAASGRRVVASFSLLADMARSLVPPGVEVAELVGPDADAHVYEPSPADARKLAQADLVLVNGLGFEGWIDRMVAVSGYRGPLVVASQGLRPRQIGMTIDPHAWQDLSLARRYVSNLHGAFVAQWPDQRPLLDARRQAYVAQIETLDAEVRRWLGAVPRARRRVLTSHDAFGYFGAAYGVDFLAPQGWATHSEPSAAAVARLIRQIKQDRVHAVFIENISDPRLIAQICNEADVRIGGTLYSDALSRPDGPAPTYLKLFEHNARSLASAL